MLLEKREEITRKNEETEPKEKQHPVVGVTGDGSKVRCCKEQYRIGTWNVRCMNQGKLEVVKQEMARVNIDILGISIRLYFHHQSSTLGVVFPLAPSLYSFWSYFSTLLQ